ncbi:MAG: hypothetical protein JKY56_15265, partial [Kofleriaceae bacterium]|nr:hypothetical protein [Kofleriaceae bacterium]
MALPPSGSNCETLAQCHSECSSANQASCVRESNMYRDGYSVAASKAKAAAILKRSCDKYKHPRSCFEYGWMLREGWMFEVERNSEKFEEYGISRTRQYTAAKCTKSKKKKAGDVDACLVRAELEIRLLNRDT